MRIHAAIPKTHLLHALGKDLRRQRAAFFDRLAGLQHGQGNQQVAPIAIAGDRQVVQIRPAASQVIGHVCGKAQALRLADEQDRLLALRIDAHGDRQCGGQAPPQEFFHRTYALAALCDRFAALTHRTGRAQGGKRQRQPTDQQHRGQQHFDQGEACAARTSHGGLPCVLAATSRNVRHCSI